MGEITRGPVNLEQPENAPKPILVIEFGIVRGSWVVVVNLEQLKNALIPIVLSEVLVNVKVVVACAVSVKQPWNALSPIVVTDSEIVREPFNPEQL